jgi:hypothetical protein
VKHLLTLTFLALIGCSNQPTSTSGVVEASALDTTTTLTKAIVVFDTTFVLKTSDFQVIAGRRSQNDDVYTHIIKNHLDTTTIFGAAGGVDVEDFNSDGFLDIILSYLSNVRVCDLYLFDSNQETFKEVEGFHSVSDAKPIYGRTETYYAYQRAGCADANWTSTLFEIRDFRVQEIGEIEAYGCDGMEEQKGITAYKIVSPDKLIEIDRFPIDTIESYEDYKRGFIADYWKTNLDQFVK